MNWFNRNFQLNYKNYKLHQIFKDQKSETFIPQVTKSVSLKSLDLITVKKYGKTISYKLRQPNRKGALKRNTKFSNKVFSNVIMSPEDLKFNLDHSYSNINSQCISMSNKTLSSSENPQQKGTKLIQCSESNNETIKNSKDLLTKKYIYQKNSIGINATKSCSCKYTQTNSIEI